MGYSPILLGVIGFILGFALVIGLFLGAMNRRAKRTEKAISQLANAVSAIPPDPLTSSVAASLATLGSLRSENLITEEEYQAKRQAHLDKIV
jgi:ABC-type dipeptide/oligopeptide/nickel transport system permease subunit